MKNQLQKLSTYITVLLICSIASYTSVDAQVVHTESFDGVTFLPAGWSAVGSISFWSRSNAGTFPTCAPHSGAGMARYNSRTAPATTIQTIATPVIDLAGIGTDTSRFSLWIFRDDSLETTGDSLTVLINTVLDTAGATRIGGVARSISIADPDVQSVKGWYQYTFDIPGTFNTNTNYILLEGVSQFGYRVYIDDVQWTDYPAVCTGTPTPGAISSTSSLICGGTGTATLSLQGETAGVTGITYQWRSSASSSGPWTDFGTSVTSISTGTLASTTYYQCLVTCANSGLSDSTAVDSVVVISNALPNVSVTPGAPTYCLNTNIPVFMTASGAVTYSWTPATGLDTTSGATVNAIVAVVTNYVVTGIDSFGCADTGMVTVTPHNTPTVTGTATSTNVCLGDSVTLNASSQLSSVTYVWSPGNIIATSITVLADSTTIYSVTGTSLYGCTGTQSTDTALVNIIPLAIAAFHDSINGRTVTFYNTSANSSSWTWLFGDGNASFQQNPVYTYSGDGIYLVTLIATGGPCAGDTLQDTITVNTLTGIQQLNAIHGLSLTPNPAGNIATVQFNLNQPQAEISVLNPLGEIISDRMAVPSGTNFFKEQLDLNTLPAGIYFVRIKTPSTSITSKLIRQ